MPFVPCENEEVQAIFQFLQEADRRNREKLDARLVEPGYISGLFEWVRAIKAHPDFASLDAFEAAFKIEGDFQACTNKDIWEQFTDISDDPHAEFMDTWDKIKWPTSPLAMAQDSSAQLPLSTYSGGSEGYLAFISLAGHLQRIMMNEPILLPCRKIAELLGCEPRTISRYEQMAQREGLLVKTKPHLFQKSTQRAAEYRFRVDLFNWETGEQISSEVPWPGQRYK